MKRPGRTSKNTRRPVNLARDVPIYDCNLLLASESFMHTTYPIAGVILSSSNHSMDFLTLSVDEH